MKTILLLFVIIAGIVLTGTIWSRARQRVDAATAKTTVAVWNPNFRKPPATLLKKMLDPLQFDVTQNNETEPAFQNKYWDNHRPGIYVDVVSGEPLFSSLDKFDSGTGWPSFSRPLRDAGVTEKSDYSAVFPRTEIRSQLADSHLGHVFNDGPQPTGRRYCLNSAALEFVPVEQMQKAGYGQFMEPFVKAGVATPTSNHPNESAPAKETAIVAGGCFWGMEEIIRNIPGVLETTVGYTGGALRNPTYEQVCTGTTGHAEAVQIVFDPAKITYEEILGYFFRMHDPTTLNRQHNDVGTQYRSAIFYQNDQQKQIAEKVKDRVSKNGKWSRPITTEITQASTFYSAEDYHQKYLLKNKGGYNCHVLRD